MGWSWCDTETKEAGIANLLKPWTYDAAKGITTKVIAHSLRGSVLWTVRERSDGVRWIGCDLTSTKGGGFGYKQLDESMGPCELTCPLTYFDMVPDPGGYATEWRKKVRAWHARQKETFIVGRRYAILNRSIPWVRIDSIKPLTGTYNGNRYRLNRPMIGQLLGEDPAMDPDEGAEKAKLPYVVEAAWGDWHGGVPKGMVGVFACRGGRLSNGSYSPYQAYFMVPQAEYDKRGNEFVIDEAQHQRVADFTAIASITKVTP